MVKAYLRYEEGAVFGVVASSESNICYGQTGKLLLCGALERLSVWNLKQGRCVHSLGSSSASPRNALTSLAAMPSSPSLVAAGYNDGSIRIWDIINGSCETTLNGHKAATTALRYNKAGSLLASGSKDTDIIVWDAVGESGLYRLRGHRDQVTGLVFLDKARKLVSSSKDTFIRVWDLDTQYCLQTIVGHRTEIWSLDVDSSEERHIVAGSGDSNLRVYTVNQEATTLKEEEEKKKSENGDSNKLSKWEVLRYMGDLNRQSTERVSTLRFNQNGTLLGCQVAGKLVEIYKVCDEGEALKKAKRRKKRKREKAQKSHGVANLEENEDVIASDVFQLIHVLRTKHKIRSFDFSPTNLKKNLVATVALSLHNNTLEVHELTDDAISQALVIDLPGHRSDVRSLTLSVDNSLLMSASHNSVKIWNPMTGQCLRTMDSGYGLCGLFVPGNRHAIIGSKEGKLEIFDVGAGERVKEISAHSGAVWSVSSFSNGKGFVSGSADHDVKFWEYELVLEEDSGRKQLSISNVRSLKMSDDVLCVRLSHDAKYLAVALLDSTIKVYFADTLKFFLSLYGHKLPVLCMDISSDGALLASGSADKNLKIWGMDFGDCHRSLFAHADSVMAVQFVRNTHYVLTVGKDRIVKYWDADKFEQLLTLEGHHAEIWCLAVSSLGDFFVTGSHDRSIRRWDRTEEPFFVEEEREKRLESLFDSGLDDASDGQHLMAEEVPDEGAVSLAGRRTQETVTAADSIIEALDLAEIEQSRIRQYEIDQRANGNLSTFQPNVMMLGLSPPSYVLRSISNVRSSDLEQALLSLPFTDALKLMEYLKEWMIEGNQVELICRVATLLLQLHYQQLITTASSRPILTALQDVLQTGVKKLKDTLGFNLAAMSHLQQLLSARSDAPFKDASKKLLDIRKKLSKKLESRPDQLPFHDKKRQKPEVAG